MRSVDGSYYQNRDIVDYIKATRSKQIRPGTGYFSPASYPKGQVQSQASSCGIYEKQCNTEAGISLSTKMRTITEFLFYLQHI
jgi:hypothetical protein